MTNRLPKGGSLATVPTRLRLAARRYRILRLLGGRGSMTLLLGVALFLGGISQVLGKTQFMILKDHDTIRVIRRGEDGDRVLANLDGKLGGNTIFRLADVLPDRYVSRELALFDGDWTANKWLSSPPDGADHAKKDVFYEEMKRLNGTIRAEFFAEEIPYGELIHEKSEKYGVDPTLVAAVIEQESRFRPRARSHVGARGLMQLMPRTGHWMGADNLDDPEQNIDAGVKYIKYLNERFHGDLKKTIAAYNAGEGNVERYRGVPPFGETRRYVKKVLKRYDERSKELQKFQKKQLGGSVPESDGAVTLR